jgi:hypothetical protein
MKMACEELTLQSALSDPLIRTVMAADHVDPAELESMLRRIAEEIAQADDVVPLQPLQTEAASACCA